MKPVEVIVGFRSRPPATDVTTCSSSRTGVRRRSRHEAAAIRAGKVSPVDLVRLRDQLRRAARRVLVVLEAHEKLMQRAGSSQAELAATLRDLGYSIYDISRFRLEPLNGTGAADESDWFCVPSGQESVVVRVTRTIRRSGLLPCLPALNPLRG
jgi:hypothetical protein